METNSTEFIILRLPKHDENVAFILQTFAITQYIFYDDRFPTKQLKGNNPAKFDKAYYDQFREKCFKIENKEISFTINEFIILAKIVDFVSKCFTGDPNQKLRQVLTEDFNGKADFDYDFYRRFYLRKADGLFKAFKDNCTNEILLQKIAKELDWKIEI